MGSSEGWRLALLAGALAGACGAPAEPRPVAVDRLDGGGAEAACVDPELSLAGPSTITGSTPVGSFAAAGARAYGRCLWLQFVSTEMRDGRACQKQIITAATAFRVPPWFGGSSVVVGVSLGSIADSPPLVASGTLTIDSVEEGEGTARLSGSLVVNQPDWKLAGTFAAPWTDLPCKQPSVPGSGAGAVD